MGSLSGGSWRGSDALRSRRAAALVAAALGLGCALVGPDPHPELEQYGYTGEPRHFMVLPLNLAIKTPPELAAARDDMFGSIAGYIRSNGDTLETISRKRATTGWAQSIIEVKQNEELENNFESAMRVYVTKLAQSHSFDSVIVPSLLYRNTKTRERTAKWDGVFRKVKFVNVSDVAKKKQLTRAFAVQIDGVSLHVMVFAPNGELIFQKYGGLDVVHDVDMANAEFTMSSRLALREKLFRESDYVEEGLAVAFDPYIPRR